MSVIGLQRAAGSGTNIAWLLLELGPMQLGAHHALPADRVIAALRGLPLNERA